jgi:parallel beta-helix repeat protein
MKADDVSLNLCVNFPKLEQGPKWSLLIPVSQKIRFLWTPHVLVGLLAVALALPVVAQLSGSEASSGVSSASNTLVQAPEDRILGPIDDSQGFTLAGNVHPRARAGYDVGAVAAGTPLERMMLTLNPSTDQQAALDALVDNQHDLRSPLFRQWLTPAAYGARFGISPHDLAQITGWLKQHGFRVEEVPASNRLVIFSGTAGQVKATFHTELHHYQVDGIEHVANSQDPQIPAALAGVVSGIVSLHDFRRVPAMTEHEILGTRAQMANGESHYLSPADFATIYNLNSLYNAGATGAGSSIAIVGRSNIKVSDAAEFRAASGFVAQNPTVILEGPDPGLVVSDQDESTLDVEWSSAVAPAAKVTLVVGASMETTDGVDLSAEYIVNHAISTAMSTSYGSCEQDMGTAELAYYNSLWEQAASEGISSFVASGASGASGCNAGSAPTGSGTAVNGLCSSPYSTCVGGTEFNEGTTASQYWSRSNSEGQGAALGYIPERVWNESGSTGGSGLWASGGGISTVYSQPAWQLGVTGTSAANDMRAVPDVSLTAARHDGYIVYENGAWWSIAGTSATSPSFAGMMALVNQATGGTSQGNANPLLYSLLNGATNPFHATPAGNNGVPGVIGFTAGGAAYNLATGLGSVDGALLVNAWRSALGGAGSSADFTLTASSTSGALLIGQSATITLTANATGTTNNRVSLSVAPPDGVTVVVGPTTLAPGTPVTVTITVTSAASVGTKNIIFTGANASGAQTLTYALNVTPPPTLSLTATSNSVAVVQGASNSVGFTVVTGGSFRGDVNLEVSGLPAGVSSQWNANPLTTASNVSSNNVMLTLSASGSARVALIAIVVTASGDGLRSTQPVTLQVKQAPGIPLALPSPTPSARPENAAVGALQPQLNCKAWSTPCTPDATILTDGQMTAGSSTLYSPSAHWTKADIGKPIDVQYAGNTIAYGLYGLPAATGDLVTTIQGVTDLHHVVLKASAITSTSGQILSIIVASGGKGYALNDTGKIGTCGATYQVMSMNSGVVALAFTENAGTGCVVNRSTSTTATSGSGKGLTFNIESVSTGATVIYGTDNGPSIDSALVNTAKMTTLYIPTGSYIDTYTHKLTGSTTVNRITGDGMSSSIIYQIGPMLQSNSTISPSTIMFNVTGSGYTIDHVGLSGTDWSTVQRANGGGGGWGVYLTNSSITSGTFTNDAFNYFWGNGMGATGGESGIQVTANYGIGDAADCINPNVNNSVITSNYTRNCGTGGIESAGSNNTISGNTGSGDTDCITIGGSTSGLTGNNIVTGNTCNGNYLGIVVQSGEQNSVISGNTASHNDVIGLVLSNAAYTTTADSTCSQSPTSSPAVLTCSDGPFASTQIGYDIEVVGSGPGGTNQYCTIAAYISRTQVTLSCNAGTTVSHATAYIQKVKGQRNTVRNLIKNNSFYSNGCTTYPVCNTHHIPSGPGIGISNLAVDNWIENNNLGNSGVAGFSQYYGILASQTDSTTVTSNLPSGHLFFDYYVNGATNMLFSDTRKASQYTISKTSATFVK